MRLWACTALALAVTDPAWSLSCLPSDIARDYAAVAASEDRYIVVRGDLFFDETLLPNRDDPSAKPQGVTLEAWVDGQSLTSEGFTRPFERDVVLHISCLAHWCGPISNGDHLLFLKQKNQSFVLEVGPCGAFVHPRPTKSVIDRVQSCARGEACEPVSASGTTD